MAERRSSAAYRIAFTYPAAMATRLRTDTLVVAIHNESLERTDRRILILFAFVFLVLVLIGLIGALLLGSFLRRRLERLGDTAAVLAGANLVKRAVGMPKDEFERLGTAINAMLDRIALLIGNSHQVSSDIAHDLRTPFERPLGHWEAALDRDRDTAAICVAIGRARRQSDTLLSLFGGIVGIAEMERGGLWAGFVWGDLSEPAADMADAYAPPVADGGRTLRLAAEPAVAVRSDRALLAQAPGKQSNSAQRHTVSGIAIVIDIAAVCRSARLTVSDRGSGVLAAVRERIKQRFVRLEGSRTTPGHGLGLNVVSAVADAHGGTLEIGDNAPGVQAMLVLAKAA